MWRRARTPSDTAAWLWLRRQFWDEPDYERARFARILCNPAHLLLSEQTREKVWHQFTEDNRRWLLKDFPLEASWRVLEIGCGMGRLMKAASPRVSAIYGVDFSPQMIRFAGRYLEDCPRALALQNNGLDLAMFRDGVFDACFCVLLFQEVAVMEIIEGYLREAARVLKPGGLFRVQLRLSNWTWIGRSRAKSARMLQKAGLKLETFEVQALRSGRRWAWVTARKV